MLYKIQLNVGAVIFSSVRACFKTHLPTEENWRFPMKTININQLQAQISRVMKDIEGGEIYEVMRYSRPIAVIGPKNTAFNEKKSDCEKCMEKMDQVLEALGSEKNDLS